MVGFLNEKEMANLFKTVKKDKEKNVYLKANSSRKNANLETH